MSQREQLIIIAAAFAVAVAIVIAAEPGTVSTPSVFPTNLIGSPQLSP
jgi:hypothetical protein